MGRLQNKGRVYIHNREEYLHLNRSASLSPTANLDTCLSFIVYDAIKFIVGKDGLRKCNFGAGRAAGDCALPIVVATPSRVCYQAVRILAKVVANPTLMVVVAQVCDVLSYSNVHIAATQAGLGAKPEQHNL